MRDGVYVDPEVIPAVESRDTSLVNNGTLLMNAAVFDYQHSSSQDDVMKWNGLNYKESWEVRCVARCCHYKNARKY